MKYKLLFLGLFASSAYIPISSAESSIDTNGDGAVSMEEILAVNPDATGERFTQFDSDADGLLTNQECK